MVTFYAAEVVEKKKERIQELKEELALSERKRKILSGMHSAAASNASKLSIDNVQLTIEKAQLLVQKSDLVKQATNLIEQTKKLASDNEFLVQRNETLVQRNVKLVSTNLELTEALAAKERELEDMRKIMVANANLLEGRKLAIRKTGKTR